ncbi:MAG TPA: hypothetical protein DIC34_18280 [Treponema sp.]|nr:hypothetical protein [Treponema sp.]
MRSGGNENCPASGRVTSLKAANGVQLDALRDSAGRLTSLSYEGAEDVAAFSFGYDAAGNMVRKNESSFDYDMANRMTSARERGRFDNEKSAEKAQLGKAEGDYRGEDELSFAADQTVVLFDYGSMSVGVDLGGTYEVGRITLDPRVTGHRIHADRFELLIATYNMDGNWTKQTDLSFETTGTGEIIARFRIPVTARYVKLHCFYDDLKADGNPADKATVRDPLITVGYFETRRDESYEYDKKGNRKTVTTTFANRTTSSSYTYWSNTDRVKTDGTFAYVYDSNGNMVEKGTKFVETETEIQFFNNEGEYIKYEYDLANRMVRVLRSTTGKAAATERARYRYGPDGLRIAKTTSAGTRFYVYGLDGNKLSEISSVSSTDTIWVLGKKFAEVETVNSTATTTYLATDQVGSVIAATDENGKVIWQGTITAFGEKGGEAGLSDRTRSYTGKDWDEDASLIYFNARWYDPELGRFVSEDPARDGVNWYAYTSRPLTSTDPTGLGVLEEYEYQKRTNTKDDVAVEKTDSGNNDSGESESEPSFEQKEKQKERYTDPDSS